MSRLDRSYLRVLYVLLALSALVLAVGAPDTLPW